MVFEIQFIANKLRFRDMHLRNKTNFQLAWSSQIIYDSRDFVERNRDALDRELSQAMYECDHPILKVLFPEGKPLF